MNTSHESYLVPFFTEMNAVFPDKWCVLHSYETLPYYSASDVDMAFSGTNIDALEILIKKVSNDTGWVLLQKLWYDVQNCYYYVLHHFESNTLLAIDFLIDNDAIGKYGFTTKVLTANCIMINDSFPIPNSEVAFCYKLIKRIVKRRSVKEDDQYLRETYLQADKEKVSTILTNQLGHNGKELILRYLTDNSALLTESDITLLHQMRSKTLNSFQKNIKFKFWEIKRSFNRIFYPSGMILSTAPLAEDQLKELNEILAEKVDILFRFVKINSANSTIVNLKAFAGSTLVIRTANKAKLKSTWSKSITIVKTQNEKSEVIDIPSLAEHYYKVILKALAQRMTKRMPNARR